MGVPPQMMTATQREPVPPQFLRHLHLPTHQTPPMWGFNILSSTIKRGPAHLHYRNPQIEEPAPTQRKPLQAKIRIPCCLVGAPEALQPPMK